MTSFINKRCNYSIKRAAVNLNGHINNHGIKGAVTLPPIINKEQV